MPKDKMLALRRPKLDWLAIEPFRVTTPDGLTLAAYRWGNPDGPELLFMHGFSQCHLSWRRQMDDAALAAEFNMVAFDLRGHGASDQPIGRAHYHEDRLWADDVNAVMDAAGLKRPTLVAWSYAGRLVSDYVQAYGQDRIAAVNYVAAVVKTDRTHWGPALRYTIEMTSDDLITNVRATRRFVHACFAGRPAGEEMDTVLAYTMAVPAKVRAGVVDRSRTDGSVLASLKMPVLVSHGTMDRIIAPAAGRFAAATAPNATLSLYDGIGHSPFWEDAPRFNRELAALARQAAGS